MPKFFVISDVHGFYDEMIKALNDAGFDKENENHWLISCGDNWDRGDKPVEVMRYLNSLPRKILIKGNHEDLFVKCCERGFPQSHDYSNGTYDTIEKFGNTSPFDAWDEKFIKALARTNFFLEQQKDYFETKNYIFVHGWIPVFSDSNCPAYYRRNRNYKFDPDWRNASESRWKDARWLNGMDMAYRGLIDKKTVVCGHWHCSYGHAVRDELSEFGEDANFEPYYDKGIIAIDACTAYTHKVNVLVLDDEFCA